MEWLSGTVLCCSYTKQHYTNNYHSVVMSVHLPHQSLSVCEVHTPREPVISTWSHGVCHLLQVHLS